MTDRRFSVGDRVVVEPLTDLLKLRAIGGLGVVQESPSYPAGFEVLLDSGVRRGPFAWHTRVVHPIEAEEATR